jgi:hypothetical protein
LLLLAPDIQEAVLFLPRTERGRDPIRLGHLQPLTLMADWQEQRKCWQALLSGEDLKHQFPPRGRPCQPSARKRMAPRMIQCRSSPPLRADAPLGEQ